MLINIWRGVLKIESFEQLCFYNDFLNSLDNK